MHFSRPSDSPIRRFLSKTFHYKFSWNVWNNSASQSPWFAGFIFPGKNLQVVTKYFATFYVLAFFLKFEIKISNQQLLIFSKSILYEKLSYSSTDNFLSPVPVSDWLIFCCWNSIIHQNIKSIIYECSKL